MAAGWAAAVHELRGPTCVIKGFADMLVSRWDDTEPDELFEMLERLHRNAGRLKLLVESLLVDARTDAGALHLRDEESLVAEAVDIATDTATTHGVEVDTSGAEELTVRGDGYRVAQILSTLVDNACRHGRPPIEIAATSSASTVTVVVHDHGQGVTPAEAEALFEQFSPLSHADGSNGLGLYTARRLARAMNGDIRYENGTGSSFALTLPRGDDPVPAAAGNLVS